MHRIGWFITLATLVAISSATPGQAASHVKRQAQRGTHAQAASAGVCSDPRKCGGSCPRKGAAATAASAAAAVPNVNGVACPVSDPSRCPASCRPAGAVATAVNARH